MLEVRNLRAKIGEKEILKGIDLTIRDGETHAIMGPNGSGKSTLSAVLVGNPLYEVTGGEAWFNGKNLLEMKPEDHQREAQVPGPGANERSRVPEADAREAQSGGVGLEAG